MHAIRLGRSLRSMPECHRCVASVVVTSVSTDAPAQGPERLGSQGLTGMSIFLLWLVRTGTQG